MVNGVSYGMHGWALGNNPVFQAWIYDPEATAGSRWTRGGSTTIPRMYHNTAILLGDGRVLIGGSDPLDTRYPSEFKLETYSPPYLTNGRTRPTLTLINGRDFGAGATIVVDATLTVNTNIRFNILKGNI